MEIIHCWKKVFSNQTLDVNGLEVFFKQSGWFWYIWYGKMENDKA